MRPSARGTRWRRFSTPKKAQQSLLQQLQPQSRAEEETRTVVEESPVTCEPLRRDLHAIL